MVDLEDFNDCFFNGDFDEVVLYTPSGGQGKPVRAVFDNEYQAAQFDVADAGIESSGPKVTCLEAEIPGVAHGDAVVVRGITWYVLEVRPDGTGLVTLMLSRDPLP